MSLSRKQQEAIKRVCLQNGMSAKQVRATLGISQYIASLGYYTEPPYICPRGYVEKGVVSTIKDNDVYILMANESHVTYIGRTQDLHRRLLHHVKQKSFAYAITYTAPTPDAMMALEESLVKEFNPLLNIQLKGK